MVRTHLPTIGVALSGGAARGIAHIAVLETLENEGVPIDAIAGTSSGSIIGALYAAGLPLAEIRRIMLHAKWKDGLKLTLPRVGLVSSDGIARFMNRLLPVRKFSALKIPFAAVAADLRTGEKVSLTSGSIAKAVQASCSLPVIFTPTVIDRRVLVDGGLASQLPVRTVREELGASKVIAVNVNYEGLEMGRINSIVKIASHLSALWAARNTREEEKLADVVIRVNTKGIATYDLHKVPELLRRGKRAAEEKLPAIRELIDGK